MRCAGPTPALTVTGGFRGSRAGAGVLLALSAGAACAAGPVADEAAACSAASLQALAVLASSSAAPIGAVCARWPADPTVEAIAAAFPLADPNVHLDAGDMPTLQLVVALRDVASGDIRAHDLRRLEQDAAFELGTRSLQLEMGNYRLAPDRLAFGLVIDNAARGPSCPEGWANRELTLYLRADVVLRPVLQHHLEAWGMIRGDACRGWRSPGVVVRDSVSRRFEVAPTRSHGLADLQLVESHERATWSAAADDPVWTTAEIRRPVRYDGHRYVVAPADDPFAADASADDAPLTETEQP